MAIENKDEIIIAKVDKCGKVVIVNTGNYIKEARRQLKNTILYQKLNDNPFQQNTEKFETGISNLKSRHLMLESTVNIT